MKSFRLTDSTAIGRSLFPEIFAKPVMLEFDQRQGSFDAGAVLLKAVERRYGLVARMAGYQCDERQAQRSRQFGAFQMKKVKQILQDIL